MKKGSFSVKIQEGRRSSSLEGHRTTVGLTRRALNAPKGATFASHIRQCLHPVLMSDECGREPMQPRPVDGIASAWSEIEHGATAPTGETVTFDVTLRMWTLWAAQCTLQNSDR